MSTTATPDQFTALPDEQALASTVTALEEHGFSVEVVDDLDAAREAVLARIPHGSTVMTNTSVTLAETGIADAINDGDLYDAARNRMFALANLAYAQSDPLRSWNDGPARKAILNFVADVTDEASADFVKPEQRIATFDNDGTLWAEKPIYVEFQFAIDRVKALAPQHPEWKTTPPFNHLLAGDTTAFMAGGDTKSARPCTAIEIAGEARNTAGTSPWRRAYAACQYRPPLAWE